MPMGEARKLMMSSQPRTARRAYEVGLVQELAPDLAGAVGAAERFADEDAERARDALVRHRMATEGGDLPERIGVERLTHAVERVGGARLGTGGALARSCRSQWQLGAVRV